MHTKQAIALDANLTEASFQLAKFHMAANSPGPALQALRNAIEQVPAYVIKAAADGDFRPHLDELNSFYEAVRKEVLSTLVPTVEQALSETVEWAETIREVAECAPTCDRWRESLRGHWGLLDLLTYRKLGFDRDRQAVGTARSRGLARMERERRAQAAAEEEGRRRLKAEEVRRAAVDKDRRKRLLKVFWGFMIPGSWLIGGFIGWTAAQLYFEDPGLKNLLGVALALLGAVVANNIPEYFLDK